MPDKPMIVCLGDEPAAVPAAVLAMLSDEALLRDWALADGHGRHGAYRRDPVTGLIVCHGGDVRYVIVPIQPDGTR